MKATWLADVLRDAGLNVVEVPGWKTRGVDLVDLDSLVWHHDGSPPGASPSVPAYMARQIDAGKAGAQTWVAMDGTWHLVAAGKCSHTGEVLPGKAGNSRALGVETDHTIGEGWPIAQLASLRRGTAAIFRHARLTANDLEFHKTICSPPGRKTDPAGLDLTTERAAVAALLGEDDDMTETQEQWLGRVHHFVEVEWPEERKKIDQILQHLNVLMLGVPDMQIPPTPRLVQEIAEKHGIDV